MATLHGYPAKVGESVYDLVWGTGTIAEVLPDARLRVTFATRDYVFNDAGQSRSVQRPTLYWHNPVMIVPQKSEPVWNKTVRICRAVHSEINAV